eukprot:4950252-Lingulodinium_polyedra.AAC.1
MKTGGWSSKAPGPACTLCLVECRNPGEEETADGPSPDMLSGVRITQKTFKDGTHDNVVDDWIGNRIRHPTAK